jgi:acyl-CoA synthetase (AMP-forming)/AMP-acid ligase II
LPIFLLANLANGLTSVIPDCNLRSPATIPAGPILEQIRRHGITRCAATPAFFQRLLDATDHSALMELRKVFVGGAPVFPRLLEALSSAMPQGAVHAVYGSTEAEPISHLNAGDISPDDRLGLVQGRGLLAGRPVDEIALRILPEQWGRVMGPMTMTEFKQRSLPIHQPGEILVSGPNVLTGYLHGRGDEETKVRVEETVWHRTGDAGFLDEGGRLWLLGRCSVRIKDGRGTLWPLAVESAAMQNPSVRRAALVAHGGRRVLAVESDFSSSLEDELKSSLAWAGLDTCRIIRRIPVDRRHHAKIDYRALAALLE